MTWCHANAITNMSSFNQVKDLCRMTCDDNTDDAFCTHAPNSKQVKFRNCGQGLHCLDSNEDTVTFANTITELRKQFIERQCQGALKA